MTGRTGSGGAGAGPRLVFLNRYFFPDQSATSRLLSDLAFDLAEAGYRVAVVTSRQLADEPAHRLPVFETVRGVAIHRVAGTRFGRAHLAGRFADYATFYPSAALRLSRLVAPGDVVVVKTDPPLASVIAWPIAGLRRARLVAWIQDLFPELAEALGVPGFRGLPARALSALRNRSLRHAERIVVLSEGMRARLAAEGLPEGKIAIIENWADGARIGPRAREDNSLRRDWGLERCFVVGYSGNMGRVHAFDTVLDAARLLLDDPRIVFLLIGGGALKAGIEAQLEAQGLSNVITKPFQPEALLPASLAVSDAHLVTLRPEAEGLVVPSKIAAATAAGRPVIFIGDPDGELARLVAASGSGIALAPGDAARLAETVRRWARDGDAVRRMGEASRALFERRFARGPALARWRAALGLSAENAPRR